MEFPERRRLCVQLRGRESQKLRQPLEKGIQLALSLVVGAPSHNRFARMKHHVQDRRVGFHHPACQALHVVERRIRRAQPARFHDASEAEEALRLVWRRCAAVRANQPLRQRSIERCRYRHFEQRARAGAHCRVVRQQIRRQWRVHEIRAAAIRVIQQRVDARVHEIACLFEHGCVRGVKSVSGPIDTIPVNIPRSSRSPR